MRKEWLYVCEKKSQIPERVSRHQETLEKLSEDNDTIKSPSPVPVSASFGGLIFSGIAIGFQNVAFCVICVSLGLGICLYYGHAILKEILDYRLRREKQNYDHTRTKADEVKNEAEAKEKQWAYEEKMKRLEMAHETEMKRLELLHQKEMKKLELKTGADFAYNGNDDTDDMLPPVSAAEYPRNDN